MKRKIRYLLLLIVILLCGTNVNAKQLTFEQYKALGINDAYIVGDYIFDVYSENHGDYSPILEDFAISARSIPADQPEYAYKIIMSGDALTISDMINNRVYNSAADFPAIDVKYIYWHPIRGAEYLTHWRSLEETLEISFGNEVATKPEGASFYSSVKKDIIFKSEEDITSAKYCFTDVTKGDCTPNVDIPNASGKNFTKDVTFGTSQNAQYVCASVTTASSNKYLCDETHYLVDMDQPAIKVLEEITDIQVGTNKLMNTIYGADFGPSGGEVTFAYTVNEETHDFTNINELPEGNIKITITATSGSGMVATLDAYILITPEPDPDTVDISFGNTQGVKGATHYSSLTRTVTINAIYGIAEAKSCVTTGFECTPTTVIPNVEGTTIEKQIPITTSASSGQVICVYAKSLEGATNTVCDEGFLVDTTDPRVSAKEEVNVYSINENEDVVNLFNVSYGPASGTTKYYYYDPDTDDRTLLTNFRTVTAAANENKFITIEAEATGNNGIVKTATTQIFVSADGSADPMSIKFANVAVEVGSGEYKTAASKNVTISTIAGIKEVKYCFTSGSTCTPNETYILPGVNDLTSEIAIDYPTAGSSQMACVSAKNTNDKVITECDTSYYAKVDQYAPVVIANYELINYDYDDTQAYGGIFEVELSVSGEKSRNFYYLDENDEKQPMTNTHHFEPGTYTIGLDVVGKNLLEGSATAVVVIGEPPVEETITMSYGPAMYTGSSENTYYTGGSISINATATYGVGQIQYCIYNADTEADTKCVPGTSLNTRYINVSGATASTDVTFTTQSYTQGICAKALSIQGKETEVQCADATFKVDSESPNVVVLGSAPVSFIQGERYTPDYYFSITEPVSGAATTYTYIVTAAGEEYEFAFNDTSTLSAGTYTLKARAIGGNGKDAVGTVSITVRAPEVPKTLSVDFVDLEGEGQNGYYASASRIISVESNEVIRSVVYCHSSYGNDCTPTTYVDLGGEDQYEIPNLAIPYPINSQSEYVCVAVGTDSLSKKICDDVRIIVNSSYPTVAQSGLYTSWTQGESINVDLMFNISYPIGGSAEYYYSVGTSEEWTRISNTKNLTEGTYNIKAVATGLNGLQAEKVIQVVVDPLPPEDDIHIIYDSTNNPTNGYVDGYLITTNNTDDYQYTYNTSASKTVTIESVYGIQFAKYCISNTDGPCTPNITLDIGSNPITYETTIQFASHINAQKLCFQATTVKGKKTGVECDTASVYVDTGAPVITATEDADLYYTPGISKSPSYLFNVEYGPSGGRLSYFKKEPGRAPITNLQSISTTTDGATVNIGVSVVGGNGEHVELERTLTIKTLKVTYDYATNGGTTFSGGSNNVVSISSYNGLARLNYTATKAGYTFVGWATEPNSKEVLTKQPRIVQDTTLYAVFKKNYSAEFLIYTTGNYDPAVIYEDEDELTCTVYNNEASCDITVPFIQPYGNYDAIGWSETEGGEVVYYGGETLSLTGNLTYYSRTRAKDPLTVTFVRFNGTNTYGQQNIEVVEDECYLYDGDTSCTVNPSSYGDDYNGLHQIGWISNLNELSDFTVNTSELSSVSTDINEPITLTAGKTYYALFESIYNVSFVSGISTISTNTLHAGTRFALDIGGIVENTGDIIIPDAVDETVGGYSFATDPSTGSIRVWRSDERTEPGPESLAVGNHYTPTANSVFYAVYEKSITLDYSYNYFVISNTGQLSDEMSGNSTLIHNLPSSRGTSVYISSSSPSSPTRRFTIDRGREISMDQFYLHGYFINGEEYAPGSTIEISGDTTVKPVFIQDSVIIKFNAVYNGGENATSSIDRITVPRTGNNSIELLNNPQYTAFKSLEYTFVGWAKESDKDCQNDVPGTNGYCIVENTYNLGVATATPGTEINVYAIFKREVKMTYVLQDNAFDGSRFTLGTSTEIKYLWNNESSVTFDLPSPTNEANKITLKNSSNNSDFLGWATDRSAQFADYSSQYVYTPGLYEARTLYSVTVNNDPLQVVFNFLDRDPGSSDYFIRTTQRFCTRYNGSSTCEITAPNRTETYNGYFISNWITNKEQLNSTVGERDENNQIRFNINADLVAYAIYDHGITIRYVSGIRDENGYGRDETVNQVVTYVTDDSVATNVSRAPISFTTKTPAAIAGYTAMGWAESDYNPQSGQLDYQFAPNTASTYDTNKVDIELYAVYIKPVILTYSYEDQEGVTGAAPAQQTNNILYRSSDLFSSAYVDMVLADQGELLYSGHGFLGWVKSTDAHSSNPIIYQPGDEIRLTGHTKVVSVWENSNYKITYHANGGTLYYYDSNHVRRQLNTNNIPDGFIVENGLDPYTELLMNDPVDLSIEGQLDGYEFLGWTEDPTVAQTPVNGVTIEVVIPTTKTVGVSDIDLYAVYGKKATAYWNSVDEERFTPTIESSYCYIYSRATKCTVETAEIEDIDNSLFNHLGWSRTGNQPVEVGRTEHTTAIDGNTNFIAIIESNDALSATMNTVVPEYEGNELLGYSKSSYILSCTPTGGNNNCEITLMEPAEDYKDATFVGYEYYCYAKNNNCETPMTQTEYYSNSTQSGYTKKKVSIDASATSFLIPGNVQVYARYEATRTLTLVQGQNGNESNYSETAVYLATDDNVLVKEEFRTRTLPRPSNYSGWTPIGWSEEPISESYTQVDSDKVGDLTDTLLVEEGTVVTLGHDYTFYAVYNKDVSITYESGGSPNTVPARETKKVYYNSGERASTKATFRTNNTYTYPGYILSKWKVRYSTDEITPGTDYQTDTNRTLTAVWSANQVWMHFDANGGPITPQDQQVTFGQRIGTMPSVTRNGYAFNSWMLEGTTRIISETTVSDFVDDFTVVAQWTPRSYRANLNANGGSLNVSYYDATFDQAMDDLPIPIRPGYNFDYYEVYRYSNYTGNYSTANVGTTYSWANETYMRAHWTEKNIVFTLDYNMPDSTPGQLTIRYNNNITGLNNPTRTGYNFDGWYVEDTDTRVYNNQTNTFTEDTTLVARWSPKTYRLNFSANGGTVSPANKQITYDQPIGELPLPRKENYAFGGWRRNNANGLLITEDTISTFTANLTVYANWYQKQIEITFDPGEGSTVSTESKLVYQGGKYGTLPIPTNKTGYTFGGWYLESDVDFENEITSQTWCDESEDTTLVAKWVPVTVTLTLDANGGELEDTTIVAVYGDEIGGLPTPEREGYTFLGWKVDDDTPYITDETISEFTEDTTLVADWEETESGESGDSGGE